MRKYYFIILCFIFGCKSKYKPIVDNYVCSITKFNNLSEAIQNKNCVEELTLREKGYKKIPSEIFDFKNLKSLDLSMNEFDSIPNEIGQLTKLEYLSIGYCNIKFVSPNIGKLKNLKNLGLLDNKLTSFPIGICDLYSIETIGLNLNPIYEVPECVLNLPNLKGLFLMEEKQKPVKYLKKLEALQKRLSAKCQFNFEPGY
jgi:Leucine-rich repeat (LRR) protein